MSILETINGHDDLVRLDAAQRKVLCREIREFLVENLSKTGGHLASNLGVVELTVALETVFNTQTDRLVFDVGHQSYVHKLLTGRQADFERLRQFGGIAGFPKPSESNTDAFVAGHASSSISIALGMARARTLQKQNYNVIALIGDGAATGGMTYEGLNDASASYEPMVVVLNDNEMSIDRNVGGMAKHLSRLRTQERYLGVKERYRKILSKTPGGYNLYKWTRSVKDWIKRVLVPSTIFENMGLTYLGPVDGHNVEDLIRLLRAARDMKRPVLLHVLTQKGKGFLPAEERPDKFHGVGKFDPQSGMVNSNQARTFSETFGETLTSLAAENPQICAITAAMPGGTGLLKFKDTFAPRLFDVGIAEEHAVSMAGGLAKQGMIPVVAIYSTFLQRAYDQILQDIALLNLHVIFAVDRAGLVGEDGETHHGVFDVGYLGQIPGMKVLCPASCAELSAMMAWAVNEHKGPVAIRYPRGGNRRYSENAWPASVSVHRQGKDLTLITYGITLDPVMAAAELLSQKGKEVSVLRILSISPLPITEILENISPSSPILVVEEVCSGSGITEKIAYAVREKCPGVNIFGMDLGGNFVTHGTLQDLYAHCGLDPQGIVNKVQEVLCGEN